MLTISAVNSFPAMTKRVGTLLLSIFLIFFVSGHSLANPGPKAFPDYQIEEITTGLDFPWSLAFLPNGELLVTERSGQLKRVNKAGVAELIDGLPKDIYVKSQGGLLDVALHPDHAQNGWIYLSYSAGTDDKNALRLLRAKLENHELVQQQVIFTVSPYKDTPVHFGGRIAFLPDNTLLLTSGDGFDYREAAQLLNNQLGKVIRINDDGSLPNDNPFILSDEGKLSHYVYSYGHRNAQAIVYDPVRKLVFSNEHGPDGGDEINIIKAGNNYGWPVITFGRDYSGAKISPFTEYPGMEQPFVDWTPSIAPSGMAIHTGLMFQRINGDLLASSLKFKEVRWLQMQGNEVIAQVSLFKELMERIRDVRVHPDGSIYLLTDSANGKVLRLVEQDN